MGIDEQWGANELVKLRCRFEWKGEKPLQHESIILYNIYIFFNTLRTRFVYVYTLLCIKYARKKARRNRI